jgi:hypothetical protein
MDNYIKKNGSFYGVHTTSASPDICTNPIRIGRNPEYSFQFPGWFKGNLDEIYLWNNNLIKSEVYEFYIKGTIPQTSVIVYWNKH